MYFVPTGAFVPQVDQPIRPLSYSRIISTRLSLSICLFSIWVFRVLLCDMCFNWWIAIKSLNARMPRIFRCFLFATCHEVLSGCSTYDFGTCRNSRPVSSCIVSRTKVALFWLDSQMMHFAFLFTYMYQVWIFRIQRKCSAKYYKWIVLCLYWFYQATQNTFNTVCDWKTLGKKCFLEAIS